MSLPAGLNVFISYARGGHAHTWALRADVALAAAGAPPRYQRCRPG